MNKLSTSLLAITVAVSSFSIPPVHAAPTSSSASVKQTTKPNYIMDYGLTVVIDDEIIDYKQKPAIHNGYIMLPVKAYLEDFGYTVTWNQKTKQLHAKDDTDDLTLTLDRSAAIFNGEKVVYSAPVMMINNTIYAPAAFISDALYRDMEYYEDEDVLHIY